ncbi:MAG: D-alanine--D-alanine ligase [Spirochaetales bacterium]|nr:D-alanine--D-alanine ligase [Spirochaetales bacterium]
MDKKRLALLFGGKSAEHEVSIRSAYNILNSIDQDKYCIYLIGIDKKGIWHLCDHRYFLSLGRKSAQFDISTSGPQLAVIPGQAHNSLLIASSGEKLEEIQVFLPVLHGPYGEDGTLQGLLKCLDRPFVGADVLGSAVGMDKEVMKKLLKDKGLPVGRFKVYHRSERNSIVFSRLKSDLGLPIYIKPVNLGSSVGISRVEAEEQLEEALDEAFLFDHRIIIEENIIGREIECSVLGNDNPKASLAGEVLAEGHFYSYDAKYISENAARTVYPAKLTSMELSQIQKLAIQAYKALYSKGLARMDFFLTEQGPIINEINTLPGFTSISMYPKLWEISGIDCTSLIDKLIELAEERYEADKKLKTSYQ